jgi:uncharacterized C2H2 Zn-finger protein
MKKKEEYICKEEGENIHHLEKFKQPKGEKIYVCGKCGKKLYYPSHYEKHVERCRGIGIECPLCGNMYPTLFALRLHAQKSHGEIWSRCPICRETFKSATVHYSRKKDEGHKALWVLTAASRGRRRVKEPSSIRRLARKYFKLFKTNSKKQYMCKDREKR